MRLEIIKWRAGIDVQKSGSLEPGAGQTKSGLCSLLPIRPFLIAQADMNPFRFVLLAIISASTAEDIITLLFLLLLVS